MLASIAPAHGKTLILQLTAAMILAIKPDWNIVICTTNEFLSSYAKTNFQQKSLNHMITDPPNGKRHMITISWGELLRYKLRRTADELAKTVLLQDESDDVIENRTMFF